MKLLIAGIDPGTTVGYAFLDLTGKLIHLGSAKEMPLDAVVEQARLQGTPILVGCDKYKTPFFVEKFSARFRAKLVIPQEDLKVEEKRKLTAARNPKNNHERDALASAVFAFKKMQPLLKRINSFLATRDKLQLFSKVAELVVKHELSMYAALALVEKPEAEPAQIMTAVIEEKKLAEKDFTKLYDALQDANKNTALLKQRIRLLEEKLRNAQKPVIKKEIKPDERLRFKDQKIQVLTKQLKEQTAHAKRVQGKMRELQNALAQMKTKTVLKRLKNLGWTELQRKRTALQLEKGDVLLVDDVNEFSTKALEYLHGLVAIIVYKKAVGKQAENALNMILIDSSQFDLTETELFGFVNKGAFEEARKNKDLLRKIVEQYQHERQT